MARRQEAKADDNAYACVCVCVSSSICYLVRSIFPKYTTLQGPTVSYGAQNPGPLN